MVHTGCVGSATLNAPPQDLALTEMELLEQNQKRLASLTGRMTTILNGFDRRLVKLESSILPIHKSTQMLSRVSASKLHRY
jgi:exocyst complex protein 7